MDRAEEAALVEACGAGDPRALERLYSVHAPSLLRYLERVLGDAGRAEDVCQEAFFRLWRRAEMFDPARGRFGAWLYRAASNLAFNRMSVRSARETPMDPSLDLEVDEDPGPISAAVGEERRSVLMAALDRLTPSDRAILVLRHLEERPVAEVSQILEIPEGTVKSRVYYAIRRLRQMLEPSVGPTSEEEPA